MFISTYIYTHLQCSNYIASNFLAQRGSNALLLAALGGSVEVVRVLIEEFDSSVDEANDVSVSPTVNAGLACSIVEVLYISCCHMHLVGNLCIMYL